MNKVCPFLDKKCIRDECNFWMDDDTSHYGCIIKQYLRLKYG